VATPGAECDGAGSCPALQEMSCAPYACSGTACGGGCKVDSDCTAGHYCISGLCQSKQPPGKVCTAAQQCASALCVDGVCCDTPCTGQCEACDVANKAGTCTPVSGAPHAGHTPCAGSGTCAGTCDGTAVDACSFPGASTTCSPATCAEGVSSTASLCDGTGTCKAGEQSACGAYACGPDGACLITCQAATDCTAGNVCVNGACNKDSSVGLAGGCGCAQGAGGGVLLLAALALASLRVRRRRVRR
jgi:hypothetical protein